MKTLACAFVGLGWEKTTIKIEKKHREVGRYILRKLKKLSLNTISR